MTKITGGTISVEDAVKHDGYPDPQYAPTRKTKVELHYAVDDDEDGHEITTQVGNLAQHHVDRLLRKEVAGPTPPVATEAKRPGRKAKTTEPVVAETAPAGKPPPVQVVLSPEPKADPTDIFSDDTPAATAVEITDKDLHDAMTRKAAELNGNPEPIKAVVKAFRPDTFTGKFGATDIPRSGPLRQKFLDALKAIKA